MPISRIVRGGLLFDGSGGAPFRADVAIAQGRIQSIGNLAGVDDAEVLPAEGLAVAPGFIDLHSHGDLILAWPGERRLSLVLGRLAQGITTEILGNCGLGCAPLFGDSQTLLQQINGWMSPAAFFWGWHGLEDYFRHLERLGLPLNVGTLVPHGPLRVGAMGLAAGEPDAAAMRIMQEELARALDAGAFGLSAGLIYPPGMYSSTRELIEVARGLDRVSGVFTCHVRGSSETLLPAVDELLRIGWDAGVAVHHSHAEAVGRAHWEKIEVFLEKEDQARAKGLRVSFDMFPYAVAATMMLAIYPPWSLAGGLPALLKRLRDEKERKRIAHDVETVTPSWPPWREGGWPHNLVRAVGWDRIQIASVGSERNRALEGVSLQELGRLQSKPPFDAISDLMVEEEGNVGQFVLDISGEAGLKRLASHPAAAFITDANDYGRGKPHPAAYGSFPRILSHFVRAERVLDLPEAIRRMTSRPAEILGIRDRGRIAEGMWADLVLFDPARVADRATFAEPRLKPEGIESVLVNGEVALARGAATGSLAGRIVRRV